MKVQSILDNGFDGIIIDAECHISNGLPNIVIVGFANKAVDEAKERIRSAFAAENLALPKKRIIINLAPADIPKVTTSLDLTIAISILQTSHIIPVVPDKSLFIGELGLGGEIRAVRGILGKLSAARSLGYKNIYLPGDNSTQAKLIDGLVIYPVKTLKEAYLHLSGTSLIKPLASVGRSVRNYTSQNRSELDFCDVVGQKQAKRALEIAAAGGHNLLMSGPPGTGKSMLAKALPSILPPMTSEEIIEVSHLHSLANKNYRAIVTTRPFRSPHHSASDTSIIGGGNNPRPGEISLSHRGVLFLDEFPEFSRATIEALRQPLEDHRVTITRVKDTLDFPANFMLIATANPCPCGNYGSTLACECLPAQISHYHHKLSGPILDRIDMHVTVEGVQHHALLSEAKQEESAKIRARVAKARDIQTTRFGRQKINSDMNNRDIKTCALLSVQAKTILDNAGKQLTLSARAYMRTIKVARTIADLEQSTDIGTQHIAEALQYRNQTLRT